MARSSLRVALHVSFLHAVFDAREGESSNYKGYVAGTVIKRSTYILQVPVDEPSKDLASLL